MKNKRNVLYSLAIMMLGVIYFPLHAQKKTDTHRPGFSGVWKAKESISMGGNIVCTYNQDDRMRSKTMKIAEKADFLTVEVPNPSRVAARTTSLEKLDFNGREGQIDHGQGRGKKFTARLSADRQTMTVKSVIRLEFATPYNVKAQKQALIFVTEVWKLNNDGKTITIQANAKSTLFGEERSWKTVFNKAG